MKMKCWVLMGAGADGFGTAVAPSATGGAGARSLHPRPKGPHRRPRDDAQPRLHRRERNFYLFFFLFSFLLPSSAQARSNLQKLLI